MKLTGLSKFIMTHDLWCTVASLVTAAHRYPQGAPFQSAQRDRDLAIAAIAFTIQLAIDEGGGDPGEMRALERELISKIEETP